VTLIFRTRRPPNNHRIRWEFEDGSLFKEVKQQVVKEVEEVLTLLNMDRMQLARAMNVQPSAITQSLAIDRGLQLTTLVRMADVLGCDVEVNFIRRYPTEQRV
jgi:hypothetical protein